MGTVQGPQQHADGAPAASASELVTAALLGVEVGLWDWNVQADRIIWLSDWCAQWNLCPCEGDGHDRAWSARVHPDDLAPYKSRLETHLSGGLHQFDIEYRIRDRDGAWIWLQERGRVIERDASGRAQRMVGMCLNIDERKRTEQALARSESRLALAVWGTQVGFWDIDVPTDEMHWWNDWCDSVDLEPCDGPGHSPAWNARIHPDDVPFTTSYGALVEGRADLYEAEYRMRTRSGGWRWILSRGRATERDAAGRAVRTAGVTIDIDARKRAEISLRDSEARLESAATGADLGLWDWNVASDTIVWMTDWCTRLGIDPSPGPSHHQQWLANIHPDDQQRVDSSDWNAIVAGNGHYESEYRIRAGSERWCWIHERGTVIERDATGHALRIVGVCFDVDARHRAEELLRTQAMILETMSEGVVLVDHEGLIAVTNPAFDRTFGYAPGELTGTAAVALLANRQPSQLRPLGRQDLLDLLAQPAGKRELLLRRRDGSEFIGEVLTASIHHGHRRSGLAVVQDITERRQMERESTEIANREQQRFGSDLHDGLGQELAGVALMLRGLANRMQQDAVQLVPDVDEVVSLVNQAIESARSMARGLSPITLERGGLETALEALVGRSRTSSGIDVRFEIALSAGLSISEASANHLYRIAQEAISNALRHAGARSVLVRLAADAQSVQLSIADDGVGIDPGRAQGGGLGLKIMEYRARMIGGVLQVAARPEGGTRVQCLCPQTASATVS